MLTFPGRAAAIRCRGCYAGKEVWVRDHGRHRRSALRRRTHRRARARQSDGTRSSRSTSIMTAFRSGNQQSGKTLIHIQQSAPVVEQRPLAAYEESGRGGAR